MMLLKSNPLVSRAEQRDSRPYALQLKTVAADGPENFDRRPRLLPANLAWRVEQVPFFARFAVIDRKSVV